MGYPIPGVRLARVQVPISKRRVLTAAHAKRALAEPAWTWFKRIISMASDPSASVV